MSIVSLDVTASQKYSTWSTRLYVLKSVVTKWTVRGFFKCVCKETESKSCAELQFLVVSSFERER